VHNGAGIAVRDALIAADVTFGPYSLTAMCVAQGGACVVTHGVAVELGDGAGAFDFPHTNVRGEAACYARA
jgi:hypothetical protein